MPILRVKRHRSKSSKRKRLQHGPSLAHNEVPGAPIEDHHDDQTSDDFERSLQIGELKVSDSSSHVTIKRVVEKKVKAPIVMESPSDEKKRERFVIIILMLLCVCMCDY